VTNCSVVAIAGAAAVKSATSAPTAIIVERLTIFTPILL
jgi:hypothetical protein